MTLISAKERDMLIDLIVNNCLYEAVGKNTVANMIDPALNFPFPSDNRT